MNPKLRAALVAVALAALAAGSRACVIALTDIDAASIIDIPAPADAGADE